MTTNCSETTPHIELINGIVYISFNREVHLDEKLAMQLLHKRLSFCGTETYPTILDLSRAKSMSSKALFVLGSLYGSNKIAARAIIINSIFLKSAINLFCVLYQPHVPSKICLTKEDAFFWLKEYLEFSPIRLELSLSIVE